MINTLKEQVMDLAWLKANAKMIHFFGLGFIQIKLDEVYRVHFYTDKLPSTTTDEEVHNHRYGFTSYILKGEFKQENFIWKGDVEGDFRSTLESCNPNKPLEKPLISNGHLIKTGEQNFAAGSSYSTDSESLHRVYSNNAITLLQRDDTILKDFATVVYHKDAPPVCPFSVKVPTEQLWAIVEEMLK